MLSSPVAAGNFTSSAPTGTPFGLLIPIYLPSGCGHCIRKRSSNYNSVVIDAANDAGGQGFVTEFSGASSTLRSQIWTDSDADSWNYYKTTPLTNAKLPPNRRILRAGLSGPGRVLEDNSGQIKEALAAYNAGLPMLVAEGGSGGAPDNVAQAGGSNSAAGAASAEGGDHSTPSSSASSDSGGCNIAGGGDPASALVAASALALALLRRRKR